MPEYVVRVKVEMEILAQGKNEPDAEQDAWGFLDEVGTVIEGSTVSVVESGGSDDE
jgi:hypothetical protein